LGAIAFLVPLLVLPGLGGRVFGDRVSGGGGGYPLAYPPT
jgi:hypothetical protein